MLGIPLPKTDVKPYNYFDTPDGQDIFKKLWAVLKPTTLGALGISTVDVMLYSHPEGYLKTVGRYIRISAPLLGIATAFVLTTNISANVRQKDDKVNWFLGGAASGAVLGTAARSGIGGFTAAVVFGLAALLKKYSVQNNIPILVQSKQVEGTLWSSQYDFSLIKHIPGKWTTGHEK